MRFAFILFCVVLFTSNALWATIYVPDDYPTIQAAINISAASGIVIVRLGTYVENIDFLGRKITVRSEKGPQSTIIDGNQLDSVVTFTHRETKISVLEGFTITNGTGTSISYQPNGGGIYCYYRSDPLIVNTILWDNTALVGPEVWVGNQGYPSSPAISYSVVKGGKLSCHIEPGCSFNWGLGMIDADPRFVRAPMGDYHISWRSSCRDTGDNSVVSYTHDREGDPRIALGRVDVGADEFYCHLYHVGDVLPGTVIKMTVLGTPGQDASIAIGWKIKETPSSTPHGNLWLSYPFRKVWKLGNVPGSGVISWDGAVPSSWLPGEQYPFQTLVGPWGGGATRLTNLHVLTVE